MIQRFERFVIAITQIYRSIQKIKSQEMASLGLKGTHVMCLFQLRQHPEGLTAARLTQLCEEDKAAVSRALSELEKQGLTAVAETPGQRRYRVPITLTEKGMQMADRMDQKIMRAVCQGAQGYSEEERTVFYRVLLQVAENLQRASLDETDMMADTADMK